jgi:hypothetical protein
MYFQCYDNDLKNVCLVFCAKIMLLVTDGLMEVITVFLHGGRKKGNIPGTKKIKRKKKSCAAHQHLSQSVVISKMERKNEVSTTTTFFLILVALRALPSFEFSKKYIYISHTYCRRKKKGWFK